MKSLVPILLTISLLFAIAGKTQSLGDKLAKVEPSCDDVFANAMKLLPQFKAASQFDSIHSVIRILENHCGKTFECFDLDVLLAMQIGRFRVEDFYNEVTFKNLETRASNSMQFEKRFPNGDPQAAYYRFTVDWATELLLQRNMEANELLVCNVLAGLEPKPRNVINQNKKDYPYLFQIMRDAKTYERQQSFGGGALIGGCWIPTKSMKILGVHPSFGLQLFRHMQRNQIDFTLQMRFLQSANPYTVMRGGTLYELTHFLGGYIGLDYTRYTVQTKDIEFGLLAGAGYDGFDINKGEEEYLKPYSIGSFNFNGGVRFNYLFSRRSFLGFIARYNIVNYKNTGGTPLYGDSFSIDLIFGGPF